MVLLETLQALILRRRGFGRATEGAVVAVGYEQRKFSDALFVGCHRDIVKTTAKVGVAILMCVFQRKVGMSLFTSKEIFAAQPKTVAYSDVPCKTARRHRGTGQRL
jgi:hypothetical protein